MVVTAEHVDGQKTSYLQEFDYDSFEYTGDFVIFTMRAGREIRAFSLNIIESIRTEIKESEQ